MEPSEFGRLVRRWRDRVSPDDVGLRSGGRRRATGLRREELAGLAGISVDYLTRLEQGRATTPSAQVVESLARALRVSDADRAVLFQLAGLAVPVSGVVPSRISPSVQRLLDRLEHTPVAVFDAAWNLITANDAYLALMGDVASGRGIERNALWWHLVGPGSRAVYTTAERESIHARLVADLRLTAARYPADRTLKRMIAELRAASPRFAELWDTGAIAYYQPDRHKTIDHPAVGRITLDCDTLGVAIDELRIMVYTAAPGSEDADRLALAIVGGTQQLS